MPAHATPRARGARRADAAHTPRKQGEDDVAESVTGTAQDTMVGKAEAESVVTAAGGGAKAATGALSHGCRHLHTRVCGHASTMTAPGGGAAAAIGAAAVEAVTIGGLAAPIAVAGTAISAHVCGHAQHAHEREQT